MNSINYIVVQAGGLGTRLKDFTKNKPKSIVSINGLPILFYLFEKFPKANFIIIGDYREDILSAYLEAFSKIRYVVVKAKQKGTCAGLKQAISFLPNQTPFMIIWSDLILGKRLEIPADDNYVGISGSFRCRWSFKAENLFLEQPSSRNGVAGVFVFKDKQQISSLPEKGEFVRYLSTLGLTFKRLPLKGTKEIGTLLAYQKNSKAPKGFICRPFNHLTITENRLIKTPINSYGREIAKKETNWYQAVQEFNFPFLPKIYSLKPLTMERIDGQNLANSFLSPNEKERILAEIIEDLQILHSKMVVPSIPFDLFENYYWKTIDRIEKVRLLVPGANKNTITINGLKCKNVLFRKRAFQNEIQKYLSCNSFCLIHGDITFSNIVLGFGNQPFFIDPRGYFGNSVLVGDPFYDWAKLYYSVATNYDQFNQGKFSLSISPDITITISSNHWENYGEMIVEKSGKGKKEMMLMMAIIWLSLSTYAWNDFDSVCGAFYQGLLFYRDFQKA